MAPPNHHQLTTDFGGCDTTAAAMVPSRNTGDNNAVVGWGMLPASQESKRTRNPIRAVVDPIMKEYQQQRQKQKDDNKEFISLALGDPTVSGSLEPCPLLQQQKQLAMHDVLTQSAGYVNALGTDELRQAIADFHSQSTSAAKCDEPPPLDPSHVVVASGCSGALDLVLKSLLDPGTCLLVPNPGFPLYQVIAESLGAHVLPYRLLPECEWQIDLTHVQQLAHQHNVRGIVVNNPSNPTGAVYSLQHLQDLVQLCDDLHLPIVADEIYGDLTFAKERSFVSVATVARPTSVPVICCSGMGKQFLVPGWRVGWAAFYDNAFHSLQWVERGTQQLAQVVLGAAHPAQALAAQILQTHVQRDPTMVQWQARLRQTLSDNAQLVEAMLRGQARGLDFSSAQGAMYLMVTFDPSQFDFMQMENTATNNTTAGEQFSARLLEEEAVFVLPGSCFGKGQGCDNAFRIVYCAPESMLQQATQRIIDFTKRHFCHPKH